MGDIKDPLLGTKNQWPLNECLRHRRTGVLCGASKCFGGVRWSFATLHSLANNRRNDHSLLSSVPLQLSPYTHNMILEVRLHHDHALRQDALAPGYPVRTLLLCSATPVLDSYD
eukprot:9474264-Pyramimonas_sp.AAC.1